MYCACVQRPEVNVPDSQLFSVKHFAFQAGQFFAVGTSLIHCDVSCSPKPYLLNASKAPQASHQPEKALLEETLQLSDYFQVTDYIHFIVFLCLLTPSSISFNKYVLHS